MLKNTQYITSIEYNGGDETREEVFQQFKSSGFVYSDKNYIIFLDSEAPSWDLYQIVD